MKTCELTGAALDWAVAKAEYGEEYEDISLLDFVLDPQYGMDAFEPSTNWSQGGPIIEREQISVRYSGGQWIAEWWADNSGMTKNPAQRFTHNRYMSGPTPLIAAMRCFVDSKCGESVNVPEELA